MNFFKMLRKCQTPFSANQSSIRKICVSTTVNGTRWRLANGYPRQWSERGTLTDAADFSYVDGRPTPYTSGQRARLLRQKEYAEKIIHLLSGIEYAKRRKLEKMSIKTAEAELALSRKLKWKGLKETKSNEELELSSKKFTWKKHRTNEASDANVE